MSKYAAVETIFEDGEVLIKALNEVGYTTVENHIGNPAHLVGYQGDTRKDTADIIVRRQYVGGASNDLGFKRAADGTYQAIISDYDSRRHNAEWLKKLKVEYQGARVQAIAQKNGYRAVSTGKKLANGNKQYIFLGR